MVTKTDPCSFSEYRIYPGRGRKFAAKDGKVYYFISNKVASLFHQRKKAVKLTWTQAWRRFNKKIKVDEISKRRTRKTTRVQKAIVGMNLDEIMRRKNEKPEERDKKLQAAKVEVKERQKKKLEAKKVEKAKKAATQKAPAVPKNAPAPKKGAATGKGKK
jgi:large subunit ribosomal protein L24e